MIELNDYTRKIIKRIAIGSAVIGVLVLTAGIYIDRPIFILSGIALLAQAYVENRIANGRYDSD